MDVCRVCLSDAPTKYVHQLQARCDKKAHTDHVQILRFCLEIHFTGDSEVSKKVCTKCFKKILIFHKFKTMALKTDAYLKSIVSKPGVIDRSNEKVRKTKIQKDKNKINDPNKMLAEDVREKDMKNEIYYIEEDLVIMPHPENDHIMEENTQDYDIYFEQDNIRNDVNKQADIKKDIKKQRDVKNNINEQEDSKEYIDEQVHNKDVDNDNTTVDENESKSKETGLNIMPGQIIEPPQDISRKIKQKEIRQAINNKRCNVCEKDVGDLVGHLFRMHHRDLCKYMCNLCGLRFHTPSSLELHGCKKAKDAPHPFQCNICQRRYLNQKLLNVHMQFTHPKEKPYLCQFCSKTFAKNNLLIKHIRVHTKEKPFKCEMCEKCFTHHSALYRHKFLHKDEKTFHCTECNKSYFNSSGLRNHMECHKREKDIQCRYCAALFVTYAQRYTHEHKVHNRDRKRRASNSVSKAPRSSGSRAPNKSTKATRVPVAKDQTYLCQLCPMTFTKRSQLAFHLKYHGQERPHKCTECPRSYLTSKGLEYHYQFAHTDNRQFQCTLCARNFSSPKYLRQHMVSHREDKAKYQCKYCGVCFIRVIACRAHELKVHEKKAQTDAGEPIE